MDKTEHVGRGALTHTDARRPVPMYLYRAEDHGPLDAEGLAWLADQLCSEDRVHPDRTMSIGWITTQAAYELPALVDALAARDAEIAAKDKALKWIADRAAKLRAGTDDWFELVEFEHIARAALTERQP